MPGHVFDLSARPDDARHSIVVFKSGPYREWCIPARFVNPIATVEIEPEEESETPAGTTEATTVARPSAPAIAGKFPGLFKPAPGRPGRTEVTLPAPKKPRD